MKKTLFALLATASLQANEPDVGMIDIAKLQPVMLEAAQKIEARHGSQRPEAQGLVERVEAILRTQAPEKRDPVGTEKLVRKMSAFTLTMGINPSLGGRSGVLLDRSQQAQAAYYQRLESRVDTDAGEVQRWLKMADAADVLKDETKKNLCLDRAVGAARALISREPENARAHALLADALGWREGLEAETQQAMQQALKLDEKQLLARFLKHEREIAQFGEQTFTRQSARLEDRYVNDMELLKKSQANPLTEDELAAMKKNATPCIESSGALMKAAMEAGDFVIFCRTWKAELHLLNLVLVAKLPKEMPHDTDAKAMQAAYLQGTMKNFVKVMSHKTEAGAALLLADTDAERVGGVALCYALGLFMQAGTSGQPPDAQALSVIDKAMQRLEEIAQRRKGPDAARAHESLVMLATFLGMAGQKVPQKIDGLLIEALKQDAEGFMTLSMLTGLAKEEPASQALAEMQLAVLPNQTNRRLCAACASAMGDWDSAFRHLDVLRKEAPDDLTVLSQRVATLLKQNLSSASLDKAAALYADVNADNIITKTAALEADERTAFLKNYALFLALRHQKENALALLTKAVEEKAIKEVEATELRELIID
jgi:hypothetical protein